jgi:hypothetical protein
VLRPRIGPGQEPVGGGEGGVPAATPVVLGDPLMAHPLEVEGQPEALGDLAGRGLQLERAAQLAKDDHGAGGVAEDDGTGGRVELFSDGDARVEVGDAVGVAPVDRAQPTGLRARARSSWRPMASAMAMACRPTAMASSESP